MGALLVVVALSVERRAVLAHCTAPQQTRVVGWSLFRATVESQTCAVLQAGLGRERARGAVLAAAAGNRPSAVWSVGFAGGLADDLHCGALVIPSMLFTCDGAPARPLDPRARALCSALRHMNLAVTNGPLITVAAPVHTPETKRALARHSGAVAVDMEAAGIADAAAAIGCPCLALKVVLDDCRTELPPALDGAVRPDGDLSWRGLGRALAAGPALLALGRASHSARKRLEAAFPAAISAWAALTRPGLSSTMSAL